MSSNKINEKREGDKPKFQIEKLPESTRKKILIAAVAVLMMIIIIFWLSFLKTILNSSKHPSDTPEWGIIKEDLNNLLNNAKNEVDGVKEQFNQFIEPTTTSELSLTEDEIKKIKEKIQGLEQQPTN